MFWRRVGSRAEKRDAKKYTILREPIEGNAVPPRRQDGPPGEPALRASEASNEIADLLGICEAFLRVSRRLRIEANGPVCEEVYDAVVMGDLLREHRRICRAIAATPAMSLEALEAKKEVVREFVEIDGWSEASLALVGSFSSDFDRLIGNRFIAAASGETAPLVVREPSLEEACKSVLAALARLEQSCEKLAALEAEGVQEVVDGCYFAVAIEWAQLEDKIASVAEMPVATVEGLILKRRIMGACLQLDGGVQNMQLLLASLLDDFDRVMVRTNANMPAPEPLKLARRFC